MKRIVFSVFAFFALVYAQVVRAENKSNQELITFVFHNVAAAPPDYSFQLSRACDVTYIAKPAKGEMAPSEAQAGDQEGAEGLDEEKEHEAEERKEFHLSGDLCGQVFYLAKSVRYFDDDFQFKKHRVAYTGDRWLGYFAPGISHKTAYTWSENPSIQQLSSIFEGVAATLEWEPKLKHLRRYDRLGLNDTLKTMEMQLQSGWLRELSTIASELRAIAEDPQIMNIARQRARHLLQASETSSRAGVPKAPKK